jgi:hypothetical protein
VIYPAVGVSDRRYAFQAHLLHQTVLKGFVYPLDSALRRRREFMQCTAILGHPVTADTGTLVDVENIVPGRPHVIEC